MASSRIGRAFALKSRIGVKNAGPEEDRRQEEEEDERRARAPRPAGRGPGPAPGRRGRAGSDTAIPIQPRDVGEAGRDDEQQQHELDRAESWSTVASGASGRASGLSPARVVPSGPGRHRGRGSSSGSSRSAGSNPKTWPEERQLGLERCAAARLRRGSRGPRPRTRGRRAGSRSPRGPSTIASACAGGTTWSSRPCRTRTGQRDPVEGVDRRALAVARRPSPGNGPTSRSM